MKKILKKIIGHSLTVLAIFVAISYFQAWLPAEFVLYTALVIFAVLVSSYVFKKKFWVHHSFPLITLLLPIVLIDYYGFDVSVGAALLGVFFLQYLAVNDLVTKDDFFSKGLLIGYLSASLLSLFSPWFIVLSLTLSMAYYAHQLGFQGFKGGNKTRKRKALNLKESGTRAEAAIYFSAPKGSLYHITMWLDEFRKLDEKVIIILRERTHFNALAQNGDFPVVCLKTIAELDQFVESSNLKAVFYVNNGMKNTHMVKYAHMNHVQLLHGDSEKSPSFNPVTQMYDKVFVAGEAGIQRYWDNAVPIPKEKFEIVGRPQLLDLNVSEESTVNTVLYAPSWGGYKLEEQTSSLLPFGISIIEKLLENGKRVIFRPHPYSYNEEHSETACMKIKEMLESDSMSSGLEHLYLEPQQTELSVFECFDQSDAIITDFSSVISDFLYSLKPIIHFSLDNELLGQYPILDACYICEQGSDLNVVLKEIEETDSKLDLRKKMKNYYLGEFSIDERSTVFTQTCKKVILGSQNI